MSLYLIGLYSPVSLSKTLNTLFPVVVINSLILLATIFPSRLTPSISSFSKSSSSNFSLFKSDSSMLFSIMLTSIGPPKITFSSSEFSYEAPKFKASSSVYSSSPTVSDIISLNI